MIALHTVIFKFIPNVISASQPLMNSYLHFNLWVYQFVVSFDSQFTLKNSSLVVVQFRQVQPLDRIGSHCLRIFSRTCMGSGFPTFLLRHQRSTALLASDWLNSATPSHRHIAEKSSRGKTGSHFSLPTVHHLVIGDSH